MDPRLQHAFDSGELIRPDYREPCFVDLVIALARLAGVTEPPATAHSDRLTEMIGASDHLVFILVDGMGDHLLERLPAEAFLRANRAAGLNTIFPSTTGCAMPTVATATWPATHGTPGWWAYLDEHDLSVTTLPFVERFTEHPLERYTFDARVLWPLPVVMRAMTRHAAVLQPNAYWDSTFSRYLRGGAPGMGYQSVPQAIDSIIRRVSHSQTPTYTFAYFPEFDAACHQFGVDHFRTTDLLHVFDYELTRLADAVCDRARLVISADHGLIDVPESDRLALLKGDPLLDVLRAPPSGEPRNPCFHVRDGQHEAFEDQFHDRFGRQFALLSTDELSDLRLLGPEPMSPFARRRFGDYFGVALDRVILAYYPPTRSPDADFIGRHAGLTPEEMQIPLIVA